MTRSSRSAGVCARGPSGYGRPSPSAAKDGARQVFTQLLSDVPQAQWELDTVFADDVLYLEW
ncbi:MAG TPA: hypothetical protein VK585_16630, partial [Jiangellaceae bacterium]|nr:hypothetical protein [Jiangellaceae bacterium]